LEGKYRSLQYLLVLLFTILLIILNYRNSYGNDAPKPGETVTREFMHDGLKRRYLIHLPTSFHKGKRWAVVFVLHGGTGSAERTVRSVAGDFLALSDREGFIAVFPDGYPDRPGSGRHHWNDGRKGSRWPAHQKNIDDVGFFSALTNHFVKIYNADPERIYATGASNGGMMCYRLACELSGKIAAVAALIANLPLELSESKPQRPVSILTMNGTKDPLMPYEGGEVRFRSVRLGKVLSTEETVEFWMTHNQTKSSPKTNWEPDKDPSDGTRVRRDVYEGGKNGTEVVLYTIEGGGHTWPGGRKGFLENLVGKTSQDINAVEIIWDFFRRHARDRF